ncbi:MAG: reverse transcriptase domain-containing protein, partial [Candidatus Phytoplasma australasiaticum]|nr:reverse transcriptase domain-containing protein [Candidatus Phytoplasma australasiaticum]
ITSDSNFMKSSCRLQSGLGLFLGIGQELAFQLPFVTAIVSRLEFPLKWRQWIKGILVSARSSVLVNGSPTFEFSCEKGIWQGDPISPFLFIIMMEAFSCLMSKASQLGMFDGVVLPNGGPVLSHLLYADDAMLMGEWSDFNFDNMRRILRIFYLCSGLKINLHKSVLYGIGVDNDEVRIQAESLRCKPGPLPFSYLGIKVGANMNRVANWEPVINTCRKRLSKWKASSLSIGGRVTLIKSVLTSLPTYYFSLFKVPKKVGKELEGLMRRFLWGGSEDVRKLPWVAWDNITKPIQEGGLGIAKLEISNKALLVKWIWRYLNEHNQLWRKVITSIHGSNKGWGWAPVNNGITSVWKNSVTMCNRLMVEGKDFGNVIRGNIGDGKTIRFWLDTWLGDEAFKVKFPTLFALESDKKVIVADRFLIIGSARVIKWKWRRVLSSPDELREREELEVWLNGVNMNGCEDSWSWHFGSKRDFSVAEVKRWLYGSSGERFGFIWSKWVPLKCNIFMWRLVLDRLPTKMALVRRHIQVNNATCSWCDFDDETSEHLFTGCGISGGVWNGISRWCRVPEIYVFHVSDLVNLHETSGTTGIKKEVFKGVIIIACWMLWRARNGKIFDNKVPKVVEILAEIKILSFLWYKHRFKQEVVDWDRWSRFDLM